jgi:hypothetical protein
MFNMLAAILESYSIAHFHASENVNPVFISITQKAGYLTLKYPAFAFAG